MKFTLIAKGSTVKPLVTNLGNFPDDDILGNNLWYFYFDFLDTRNYHGYDRASGVPAYMDYSILDLSSGIQPLIDLYPELLV